MTFRTFIRPLMVSLSLAFATTAAAPAFADGGDAKAADHANKGKSDDANKGKSDDAKHKGRGKAGGLKQFPIEADKFSKHVEAGLAKAKEKLTNALSKSAMPEAEQKKVLKQFEDGAGLVRTAAKRVATDGTVTKAEAKEVRELVKTLKEKVRANLPEKADKGDHGKGKGKGKAHDKPAAKPAPKDV